MKFLFVSLFSFYLVSGFNQNKVFVITYKIDIYGAKDSSKENDDPKKAFILKKTSIALKEAEFELYFNNNSSLYIAKDKIIPEKEEIWYKMGAILGGISVGEKQYKNIDKKIKIKQTELGGQIFRIEYPFEQFKWQITTETKIINGYKCYKAFTHFEEYDYRRKKNLTFDPSVWFTNDLPFPYGPNGYDGLPGLVLEASMNGKMYLYASEIKKDVKGIEKILEEPNKGKILTSDAYNKLLSSDALRQ